MLEYLQRRLRPLDQASGLGARRQRYSSLNCLVLAGSRFIMAPFKHRGQDGSERKKSSGSILPLLSPLRSYLLVFLSEWSCRTADLRLNPVPSYLASAQPASSRRGSSPALRPQRELMYDRRGHHGAVQRPWGQLLFVCTIYVGRRSAANGSIMQSVILAMRRSRPLG